MEPPVPASGDLTFVFADVEGSTRLAELHGSVAGAALARYHDLVSEAAERHGGRIFERIGDGAYACFADAAEAVAAADDLSTDDSASFVNGVLGAVLRKTAAS